MMWFILTIAAMFLWGCADVFYKLSMDNDNPDSYLEVAVTLGLIMGLLVPILTPFSESGLPLMQVMRENLLFMLVPIGYGVSMLYSNIGLKYLEVSIFSPLQNASGAFPVIILTIYYLVMGRSQSLWQEVSSLDMAGTVLIICGIIALSYEEQRLAGIKIDRKHIGASALLFPLIFCIFDTLETVICAIILEGDAVDEADLSRLYGAVFFVIGLICWLYIWHKRGRIFNPFTRSNAPRIFAAVCEGLAYICYVYAIGQNPLFVAPIIASFCVVSVILSRIFLHEKLESIRFVCVAVIISGIVMLGISEGLSY